MDLKTLCMVLAAIGAVLGCIVFFLQGRLARAGIHTGNRWKTYLATLLVIAAGYIVMNLPDGPKADTAAPAARQ